MIVAGMVWYEEDMHVLLFPNRCRAPFTDCSSQQRVPRAGAAQVEGDGAMVASTASQLQQLSGMTNQCQSEQSAEHDEMRHEYQQIVWVQPDQGKQNKKR